MKCPELKIYLLKFKNLLYRYNTRQCFKHFVYANSFNSEKIHEIYDHYSCN